MVRTGLIRPISGSAIAVLLVLGGCAQVTETFESARSELVSFLGEDDTQGARTSETARAKTAPAAAGAKATASGKAAETASEVPYDNLYQKGLTARAKGADKTAFKHFREAAKKRHPGAAYHTGLAYLVGRGVKQDKAKGEIWMDRAASYGDPNAQFHMGQAYWNGDSVEANEFKAAGYFAKAAAQGHARAQHALGEAYSSSRGVPKNLPWAARWYGKAAHQGLHEAQYAYGLVHARGLGLPIDRTEGYRWLLLAARAGHDRAEVVRKAMQAKMAPEMVKRAEAWVERFQPQHELAFTDQPTIMYVQQVLNNLGYSAGPVDGQPGTRTKRAISAYQKKSGQSRDGRITQQLVERLVSEQTNTN